LERILLHHPEVAKVSTEIGVEPDNVNVTGYSMNRLNTASMMITLTDKSERRMSVWELIDQVRDELPDIGQRIHCLQIKEMGSDVMASSDAPVQILVTGRDPHVLSALSKQVADIAGDTPGAVQVSTSWSMTKTPYLIEHDGLKRAISVLAYYRKNGPPSMDLTMSIVGKSSSDLNFPPGYTLEMRGDMTEMMGSFARLLKGLALALVLITLVLIAQFGDFFAPGQMLLSLPLELTGVFTGLYLAHQTFSSVSILAVIILTGMDVTTAILLIDQILRRRRDTRHRNRAVAAACRDRLRPILMTSLITIITMLPIAFFPSTGMDAYQPLGTVVVCGLLAGTLLSLLVVPVMHSLIDDLRKSNIFSPNANAKE
jgi:multidrug efflux pump subunit AcrB